MIFNSNKNSVIARKVAIADSFLCRMVGLLNRASIESGEALIITRCNSIHMFFMRFPIDVIFIDEKNQVVGLVRNLKPFALSPIFWKASRAIELSIGIIDVSGTALGDILQITS